MSDISKAIDPTHAVTNSAIRILVSMYGKVCWRWGVGIEDCTIAIQL